MKIKIMIIFSCLGILGAQTPKQPGRTLTLIAFGDNNHEREVIFVFMARNGLTLLEQNRINAGTKSRAAVLAEAGLLRSKVSAK